MLFTCGELIMCPNTPLDELQKRHIPSYLVTKSQFFIRLKCQSLSARSHWLFFYNLFDIKTCWIDSSDSDACLQFVSLIFACRMMRKCGCCLHLIYILQFLGAKFPFLLDLISSSFDICYFVATIYYKMSSLNYKRYLVRDLYLPVLLYALK